jgi:hypothetical protein
MNFLHYLFTHKSETGASMEALDELEAIFNSTRYQEKAREVCGGSAVFEPFQVNLITMGKGFELPMHLDAAMFYGADRFTHPQWLLSAMAFSGLWDDKIVPQIQGVAWLTNDTERADSSGGQFFYYPRGPAGPATVAPRKYNAALVVDGVRVVHGVERYFPDTQVPPLSKDSEIGLRYDGAGSWDLVSDGDVKATYPQEELRLSLVWRARCHASEEARDAYLAKHQTGWGEDLITVESVLDTLEADLRSKGVLKPGQGRPPHVEFATMIMENYLQYPFDHKKPVWFPYNYCVAPRVLFWRLPWLQSVVETALSPLCGLP